jgi:hypothetical protein
MRQKVNDLLRKGMIQKYISAYRAPIMLVPYIDRIKPFLRCHQKGGQRTFYRLTIDYRLLNEVIVHDHDAHPLQLVNDILDNIYGSEHYSDFYIKDAFWCCLLHRDSRHKSAFATHNDLLEWIVMPQGC